MALIRYIILRQAVNILSPLLTRFRQFRLARATDQNQTSQQQMSRA